MGPDWDPDAVVNPQLQVYGVRGLRVVDASIMPTLPSAHTNAVVLMIGEKGADLVKEFWRNPANYHQNSSNAFAHSSSFSHKYQNKFNNYFEYR